MIPLEPHACEQEYFIVNSLYVFDDTFILSVYGIVVEFNCQEMQWICERISKSTRILHLCLNKSVYFCDMKLEWPCLRKVLLYIKFVYVLISRASRRNTEFTQPTVLYQVGRISLIRSERGARAMKCCVWFKNNSMTTLIMSKRNYNGLIFK